MSCDLKVKLCVMCVLRVQRCTDRYKVDNVPFSVCKVPQTRLCSAAPQCAVPHHHTSPPRAHPWPAAAAQEDTLGTAAHKPVASIEHKAVTG